MKFSIKLLLCTMIVMAIAFGFSGFYFVNYVFETALDREVGQALDENSILRFAFETAALNVPAKYDVLQDHTIEQIASNMETGGHDSSRLLRLSDEEKNVLYISSGFDADNGLLDQTDENTKTYRVIRQEDSYYIQTGITVNALDRILYLETLKDVSEVFRERQLGFSVYRRVTILMLVFGTVLMLVISSWLTKPIRLLTRATKRMAAGDYGYRARQISNDELGQLTTDFNHMANVLEENINKLEEEIQAREDFVAAFAHELKTPLTAIIGYADMLRSRKLDEEKSFLSANYIYTEGKRLEAMSLRLLDIIVTKKEEVQFQLVPAASLFDYLKDMFASHTEMEFHFHYESGMVRAEANLIKSVLVNLLDNAFRHSGERTTVTISAERVGNNIRFQVSDDGVGIPEGKMAQIFDNFFTTAYQDGDRQRGVGLGLTICKAIVEAQGGTISAFNNSAGGATFSVEMPMEDMKGE